MRYSLRMLHNERVKKYGIQGKGHFKKAPSAQYRISFQGKSNMSIVKPFLKRLKLAAPWLVPIYNQIYWGTLIKYLKSLESCYYELMGYALLQKKFPLVSRLVTDELSKIIEDTNSRIVGRYPGSKFDKLAYLSALHTTQDLISSQPNHSAPLAHLEIGTLFGGSLVTGLRVIRKNKGKQPVIAIDPLDGYYGAAIDSASGLKVSHLAVLQNLRNFGLPEEQVIFKMSFSTNAKTIEEVKRYSLLTLFIDGDHTYEGVKADWDNYNELVIPSGFVIFDNYSSLAWLDVKRFVDELMPSLPKDKWKNVGKIAETFLLQCLK